MPVGPMGEPLPYPEDEMGAGLPPAVMGMLGGEQAAPPTDQPAQMDSAGYARELMSLLSEWREVEEDDEDLLAIEQVSSMVQKLLAKNQKESQDAMQGKLSPRLMSRAYGGA